MPALQSDFASALLDPERPIPDSVIAHSARHPLRRFAVYRNNVVVGLVNALRAKFPATERIVGAASFAAMARVYVVSRPPHSKILHRYGKDFGDFIAGFAPASELPYLGDVARLEAARTRAYHAADAAPLEADAFAGIDPHTVGARRFTLHPSLTILRSRHPVVTIWAMNAGEAALAPVDEDVPEDALILRPALDVTVRLLPHGGAPFILALQHRATLAEAAARAASEYRAFDLTGNLAGLIGAGAITGFSAPQGATP